MQCCLSSQSLAPLLSPEDGEQRLKVPSFKSWLGLSSGQHSSIRPVGVTSLRQNMLLLPRIYQGFRSSVPGNRIKHQILKQRMLQALLLFYSYQEMTRVLGDLGQERRIEMDTFFPLVYRMKLASIVKTIPSMSISWVGYYSTAIQEVITEERIYKTLPFL